MNVLLLHPEDDFESRPGGQWDLIVDLGRAPASTYQQWSREAGCRVVSFYDTAEEVGDLCRIRDLFSSASGSVVDQRGIDWWNVLLPMLLPDFQKVFLLQRLADQLPPGCKLHTSRPDSIASALQRILGAKLSHSDAKSWRRKASHYQRVFSRLDLKQITQICADKFDPHHAVRRRLARRSHSDNRPTFLLPSAYINVSRTAVAYAALVPDRQFLLVTARRNGEMSNLPPNVRMISLDGYFGSVDDSEVFGLLQKWQQLKQKLTAIAEFQLADALGLFARIPAQIRWGLAIRDAWSRLLDANNIVGCLSADDMNPYTSLPTLLAKRRNLPTLACHHGALDFRMAIKPLEEDVYLVKGEMERDYLARQCGVNPDRLGIGAPSTSEKELLPPASERKSLVFFSEPYGGDGWRIREVYRDIAPKLCALAEVSGLQLVFKLHPYESIKGHQKILQGVLSSDQLRGVKIVSGPITPELWRDTRFAMTAQSTMAIDCAERGIPIFLCSWLRTTYGGYVAQFLRSGIGTLLESSDQISQIPQMLAENFGSNAPLKIWKPMEPAEFRSLLSTSLPLSA